MKQETIEKIDKLREDIKECKRVQELLYRNTSIKMCTEKDDKKTAKLRKQLAKRSRFVSSTQYCQTSKNFDFPKECGELIYYHYKNKEQELLKQLEELKDE